MDNQEQSIPQQTETSNYAFNPQSTNQNQSYVPNTGSNQVKLPVMLGLLFIGIFLTGLAVYFFLGKKAKTPTNMDSISSSTKAVDISSNSSENNSLIKQIQTRIHIKDQKNIGQSGSLSSGFLDPILFSKKASYNNLFKRQVFAAENNLHPFLFYIVNKTKIDAFDIATGNAYVLFNLDDALGISRKNGTAITKAYFLNGSKKIIFQLQERLDDNPSNNQTIINNLDRFKISVKIYDIATKQLNEIISTIGPGGSIAGWSGLSISPDENYVFMFYNNQETIDPFADVPAAPNSEKHTSNATYFFYNLKSNSLDKFKLSLLLSGPGTVKTSWQEDSSSVFLSYTKLITSFPASIEFIKIFPNGHSETILEKKSQINSFEKSQYLEPLKKVFYIASETSDTNASQFGYYDVSSQTFNLITPQNYNSLKFIYDYTKGFIYDTFQQVSYDSHSGGITNTTLNYYDLQTQTTKKIIDQNLNIINFNGDYSHLLVSSYYNNKISQLYDLNIATGELLFLHFAPVVFSVYSDDVYTSETSTENNLPTVYPTIYPTVAQLPSPTPDPTINWQSYTNTTYSYSIKYPPAWTVQEINASASAIIPPGADLFSKSQQNTPGAGSIPEIILEIVDKPFTKPDDQTQSAVNHTSMDINNIKGDYYPVIAAPVSLVNFDLPFDKINKTIRFSFPSTLTLNFTTFNPQHIPNVPNFDEATFKEIISTFKFTN